MHHMNADALGGQKGVSFPGTEAIGSFDLQDVGVQNWTSMLCKSS